MNKQGAAKLAVARRVNWFFEKYKERFGEFLESTMVKRLKELIIAMQGNGDAQHSSVTQHLAATAARQEKREVLRVHQMQPISATARAKLTGIPAPKMARFFTPDSAAGDVALLHAARAMAGAAKEYEEVFKAEGHPADFLAQLDQAAADLQDTLVGRDGDRMERRRARIGVERQGQLVSELIAMLRGFVIRKFARDPQIIGEWEVATRVGPLRSHRRVAETPDGSAPVDPTPAGAAPTRA